MQNIVSVVKLSLKTGLCGGALYLTHTQGVWGDVEQGVSAWRRLKTAKLSDFVGEEYSSQVPALELPKEVTKVTESLVDVSQNLATYYNCSVRTVLGTVDNLPDMLNRLGEKTKQTMAEKMK